MRRAVIVSIVFTLLMINKPIIIEPFHPHQINKPVVEDIHKPVISDPRPLR